MFNSRYIIDVFICLIQDILLTYSHVHFKIYYSLIHLFNSRYIIDLFTCLIQDILLTYSPV